MKFIFLFIFSSAGLFAAASNGLKFYAIFSLEPTTGSIYIDDKGEKTIKSGKYILEIKGVLENNGSKEVEVATGCKWGKRLNGGICRYYIDVEGEGNKLVKPSLCALMPVTLKPGELTVLSALKFSFNNLSEVPDKIIVIYSVDDDLHMLYPDLWSGDLQFELPPRMAH